MSTLLRPWKISADAHEEKASILAHSEATQLRSYRERSRMIEVRTLKDKTAMVALNTCLAKTHKQSRHHGGVGGLSHPKHSSNSPN